MNLLEAPTPEQTRDTVVHGLARVVNRLCTEEEAGGGGGERAHLVEEDSRGSGGVAVALTRALCILNRACRDSSGGADGVGAPSGGVVGGGTVATSPPSHLPRVLVFDASVSLPARDAHHLAMMNAVFAAENLRTPIDSCMLSGSSDSAVLQQAAHLTGGVYLNMKRAQARLAAGGAAAASGAVGAGSVGDPLAAGTLLQHFLTHFLSDVSTRAVLRPLTDIRGIAEVNLKAHCYVTHKALEVGGVCSICLSVYSEEMCVQLQGSCRICGTKFTVNRRPPKPGTSAAAAVSAASGAAAVAKRKGGGGMGGVLGSHFASAAGVAAPPIATKAKEPATKKSKAN